PIPHSRIQWLYFFPLAVCQVRRVRLAPCSYFFHAAIIPRFTYEDKLLERNTETEIKEGIKEGVERWLLPALHGGKQYILDNWEKYSFHHLSEMVHTALEQWSISGELPAKQNH
ncbi:MAG: hypothetical protein UEW60_07525, partial [Christensenellales bacterium]|nr:hypothetical protein [Christensenellales bacterium]